MVNWMLKTLVNYLKQVQTKSKAIKPFVIQSTYFVNKPRYPKYSVTELRNIIS